MRYYEYKIALIVGDGITLRSLKKKSAGCLCGKNTAINSLYQSFGGASIDACGYAWLKKPYKRQGRCCPSWVQSAAMQKHHCGIAFRPKKRPEAGLLGIRKPLYFCKSPTAYL